MFYSNNTLEEEIRDYYKTWHYIKLTPEDVTLYTNRLKRAANEGKSILKELDDILIHYKHKKWKEKYGHTPIKSYKNTKEGRDYERENIRRYMRTMNMSEAQAIRYIKYKKEEEEKKILLQNREQISKDKPNVTPFSGFVIWHNGSEYTFTERKAAVTFLMDQFGYSIDVARTTLARNIKGDKKNIRGWAAYFF